MDSSFRSLDALEQEAKAPLENLVSEDFVLLFPLIAEGIHEAAEFLATDCQILLERTKRVFVSPDIGFANAATNAHLHGEEIAEE